MKTMLFAQDAERKSTTMNQTGMLSPKIPKLKLNQFNFRMTSEMKYKLLEFMKKKGLMSLSAAIVYILTERLQKD